uniref:Type III secretion effector protein n=1 Tax=Angiostrongylus cantonensis TaxID=6313 RepID=A0A0K0CWZ8_ANGCA
MMRIKSQSGKRTKTDFFLFSWYPTAFPPVIKVDSSEGKVQLPTTVGDHPTAERAKHEKADILSELMSEAKKLRNAVDERKPQDQKASNTVPASDGTTQSNQSLSREDVTKMMARIGSLSGDFLSGLMSIASDLSKAVGERNPDVQSTNTNAPKTNESAQGSQQFNQQDIEKLTAGIGSLVGTIRDKASDIFHKPVAGQEQKELKEKPEEKSEEKPEEQPVIDDVEGESKFLQS